MRARGQVPAVQCDAHLARGSNAHERQPHSRRCPLLGGLALLERLGQGAPGLTSEELRSILGARSVKGIGAALSGTRLSLRLEGIRLDEALVRRQVRGRSLWSVGPRIAQARHALEHARRMWTRRERKHRAPLEEAPPGHPGPVLVLRTLASRGATYAIDGGIAGLDARLDDEWFEFEAEADGPGSVGEICIDRIEPGSDGRSHPVPEGYVENGIWVRGRHDYANPRVAAIMGRGQHSTLLAWIGEARWFERRIVLVDAVRQVQEVRAQGWLVHDEQRRRWHAAGGDTRFRYVEWIGSGGPDGPSSAPPLRMRLRCWYEVVIETGAGKRVVLREEGLRGDDARTAARAIGRWRTRHARPANELVVVRGIRVAKRQPRPMPPVETDMEADGAIARRRDRD